LSGDKCYAVVSFDIICEQYAFVLLLLLVWQF